MKHELQNIFAGVTASHEPILSEVIKSVGWGSNRDIRQKGFRIDIGFNAFKSPFFSQTVKSMPVVKDPKLIITDGCAILTKNGQHVIAFKLKQEDICLAEPSKEDASLCSSTQKRGRSIVNIGKQMTIFLWLFAKRISRVKR